MAGCTVARAAVIMRPRHARTEMPTMSLQMKAGCETCEAPLGNEGGAYICSYECTFCPACARDSHRLRCPNCGGELVPRPRRRAEVT